jgi:hypothetical protein
MALKLSHVKYMDINPMYNEAGYLTEFLHQRFGTIPFNWLDKSALDYLLKKFPCEIHADGVKFKVTGD